MPLDDQISRSIQTTTLAVLDKYQNIKEWLGTEWLRQQATDNFRRGVGPLVELLYLVGREDVGPEVNGYFRPAFDELDRLINIAVRRWSSTLSQKAQEITADMNFRNARRTWWAFLDELCWFKYLSSDAALDRELTWTEGDGPDFSLGQWDLEVTRIETEERDYFEEKLKTSDAWMRWNLTICGAPNNVVEAEKLWIDFNRYVRHQSEGTGFKWQMRDMEIQGKWVGKRMGYMDTTNFNRLTSPDDLHHKLNEKIQQKASQAQSGRPMVVAVDMQDAARFPNNAVVDDSQLAWSSRVDALVPFWFRLDTYDIWRLKFHANSRSTQAAVIGRWFPERSSALI